mmetsp:Transcript_74616/g.136514  ORF Transcript_74616/g.136514 Transcript_74616/m.136514 type:complete len:100 (-) Transcript_74616:13-312(-)
MMMMMMMMMNDALRDLCSSKPFHTANCKMAPCGAMLTPCCTMHTHTDSKCSNHVACLVDGILKCTVLRPYNHRYCKIVPCGTMLVPCGTMHKLEKKAYA